MNTNLLLSIIGLAGGLICVLADLLLDLKGKGNEKLGAKHFLDSNWVKMPAWRFSASILLAMFAVPMYSMGVISLGNHIALQNEWLGNFLKFSIFVGAMGGFFIHAFACITPILYKEIMKRDDFPLAESVIMRVYRAVIIPFGLLYLVLMLVPTAIVGFAILTGLLPVPVWFILLNPVVFQIVGWILRAVNKKWFREVPSIFMASLGLAMFGVIGIVIHL